MEQLFYRKNLIFFNFNLSPAIFLPVKPSNMDTVLIFNRFAGVLAYIRNLFIIRKSGE